MSTSVTVEQIRAVLSDRPLGGTVAPGFDDARVSAVLVALADGPAGAEVLLTKRSMTVGTHRGQISFPGGRLDPGESTTAAALREADEEVALAPHVVDPFAELTHLNARVSMSYIVPVVAAVPAGLQLAPASGEVDRVFWVPLADFRADGVHHSEWWTDGVHTREVHFYDVADEKVWGATGAMLHELLGLL